LILWVQQLLVVHTDWADYAAGGVDYAALPVLLFGPAFAIGALGGDAIESFFKRRIGITSGKAWVPFDQLDYIIGSVLISLFFVILTPLQYVFIFIIWFAMHFIASYIGYLWGLKKDPV
jgi:CDP-2,3-bis-(O-geranylgeranyl)-sn-glycerol synthase